jgi:hypothetical protein
LNIRVKLLVVNGNCLKREMERVKKNTMENDLRKSLFSVHAVLLRALCPGVENRRWK